MDMTGEYRIAAPRDAVWAALNDPEILKSCIAGCDDLTRSGENEFTARVIAKIGPVKASFGGKVTLSDINPPHGYTITGEGQGGAAGFAKGSAKVALEPQEGGTATLLKYTAGAQIGGKLAQIGSRLVEGSAKKMADEFFAAFAGRVQTAPAMAPAAAEPPALEAALEQLAKPATAAHGHGHAAVHPTAHVGAPSTAHPDHHPATAPTVENPASHRSLVILGGVVVVLLLAVIALFFF